MQVLLVSHTQDFALWVDPYVLYVPWLNARFINHEWKRLHFQESRMSSKKRESRLSSRVNSISQRFNTTLFTMVMVPVSSFVVLPIYGIYQIKSKKRLSYSKSILLLEPEPRTQREKKIKISLLWMVLIHNKEERLGKCLTCG